MHRQLKQKSILTSAAFSISVLMSGVAMSETETLTRSSGAPVGDNQDSYTAGPRGPTLLEDHHFLEKLALNHPSTHLYYQQHYEKKHYSYLHQVSSKTKPHSLSLACLILMVSFLSLFVLL